MMSGYCYGDDEPTAQCPYCSETMSADFVDIGVGYTQCGPYHCNACGASQIGPEGDKDATEEERETGFYKNQISPYANTCQGAIVDHKTAKQLYNIGLLDEKQIP